MTTPEPSTTSNPITEYYHARSPYTALLQASHAQLPQWRDPAATLNRKPANEPSPFEDEREGQRRILGEEEENIREGMRKLAEKFREAELKEEDGERKGGKEMGNANANANANANGKK